MGCPQDKGMNPLDQKDRHTAKGQRSPEADPALDI